MGSVCPSVGDRGFLLGEGEFQPVQQLTQVVFDFLGFFTWSGKTKQDIICISTVSESSIRRIGGIQRRKLLRFASECLCRLWLTIPPHPTGLLHEFEVGWIVSSAFSLVIGGKQLGLNRFIKPIQVNVGQNRPHN